MIEHEKVVYKRWLQASKQLAPEFVDITADLAEGLYPYDDHCLIAWVGSVTHDIILDLKNGDPETLAEFEQKLAVMQEPSKNYSISKARHLAYVHGYLSMSRGFSRRIIDAVAIDSNLYSALNSLLEATQLIACVTDSAFMEDLDDKDREALYLITTGGVQMMDVLAVYASDLLRKNMMVLASDFTQQLLNESFYTPSDTIR